MSTVAFIDGQNLHLGVMSNKWNLDHGKFRRYLKDKFWVEYAYYYLWFVSEEEQDLYNMIQKAWYIIVFREHSSALKGKKKGNVDSDIIFDAMKMIYEDEELSDVVLVSGDGDYIKLVQHLIKKKLLKKIIFPSSQYSSLYNNIKTQYGMTLHTKELKKKLSYKKSYTKKEMS